MLIKSINQNARGYWGEDTVDDITSGSPGDLGYTIDPINTYLLNKFGVTDKVNKVLGVGDKNDVATPEMGQEEKDLLKLQTQALTDQIAFNEKMMPIYAHQMHYKVEGGEWIQMTDNEWYNSSMTTDRQRQEWDIAGKQMKRYEQALAGEIPLTQQMKDQKQTEFRQLADASGITGDTVENAQAEDTIGVQKLGEFQKRWGLVEEAQRYGELGTTGQAMLQSQGLTNNLATQKVGTLSGIGNWSNNVNFGSLLQPYQAYNQMGYQASAQNQSNQMQQQGSLLNLGGMLGAAYLMSSRTYKKDIKAKTPKDEDKALKSIRDTKSYEYRYKNYMGFGKDKMLGAIAEESPDEVTTPDKKAINLGNKIELIGMGLKSLARKMDKLERKVS